jgi:predicted AlkP superfamily pyrophosphatase or phosphodiesterase
MLGVVGAVVALLGQAGPLPAAAPPASAAAPRRVPPRLLLLVAVDQFRYDYLTRFGGDFKGGLDRLLRGGAVFTNAHLQHYPTVTAVGHATMLTGAPPSISGIVGNDWYERETRRNVQSVFDPAVRPVGAEGAMAASPARLLVSTVADELKLSGRPFRALGLSLKDRAAILSVGRMADGAYWFDQASGAFVTSTWYRPELPGWLQAFNARKLADGFAGREWAGGKLPGTPGLELRAAVAASPFGNEILLALAEAALSGEAIGRAEGTDVLSVSFSSNDAVGHAKGPHSPEVAAITRETDRVVGLLLAAVDRQVGLGRTIVALTADHGVAPVPELLLERRMPGGRFGRASLQEPIARALESAFGPGEWIEGRAGSSLYLNRALLREKGLETEVVAEKAAEAARELPPVYRALTRGQLLRGAVPEDPWCRRLLRGFHPARSGDVEILLYPYWIGAGAGTTHGTPYSYDTHVPLLLSGPGVRPGLYHEAVALDDLAPTLATLLEVETPSGSSGRVLTEALARP